MPYKVIFVDDNQMIIESLLVSVDWNEYDCEVVGTAISTQDAIQLVDKLNPDIVFTDINMPGKDGLEMIEYLKSKEISSKFIIISGYGEFLYAQRALQLGAFDFILKPIDTKVLVAVLNNVIKVIKNEQYIESKIENHDFSMRCQILSRASQGCIEKAEDVFEDRKHAKMFNNYSILMINLNEDNKELISTVVCRIQNECKYNFNMESFAIYRGMPFVLIRENESEKSCECMTRIMDIYKSITSNFDKCQCVGTAIYGIKGVDMLQDSCKMCFSKLQTTSFEDKNHIIFIKNSNSKEDKIENDINIKIREFADTIYQESIDNKKINMIIDFIHENADSIDGMKNDVLLLFSFIHQLINNNQINYPYKCLELQNKLSNVKHIDQLDDIIHMYFIALENGKEQSYGNYSKNVRLALKYIDENISDIITLDNIANKISISPTYLSAQIKKDTGYNFVDIINQKRIKLAKHLIDNSTLNLEEISRKCGFQDYSYFSQVFKKYTNQSPRAFQKRCTIT